MKHLLLSIMLISMNAIAEESCAPLLNFSAKTLRSPEIVDFCQAYRGKVILAVNTASQCGFTPQFKGLEALYQRFKDQGLVVLGFPSGDFFQEFDEAEKTQEVCYINYGVTFPMFAKSAVRGDDANAFFRNLAAESGTAPKWNFFKYLIDRNGKVVAAYASTTKPDDADLIGKIEAALKPTP